MDEVAVMARPSRAHLVVAAVIVASLLVAGLVAAGVGRGDGVQAEAQPASAVATPGANRAFVWGAFQLVAGQAPDDAALTHWSAYLDRGGDRHRFVAELLASPWSAQRTATRLYAAALGRVPSPAEITAWTGPLGAGRYESVVASIVGSREAVKHAGSHAQWVDVAYRTVMGRPADAHASAHWTAMLARNRATPAQVVAALTDSWEYHAKVVKGMFRTVLARRPDDAGLVWWATQVADDGVTGAEASFFSTDEVYQRIVSLAATPAS